MRRHASVSVIAGIAVAGALVAAAGGPLEAAPPERPVVSVQAEIYAISPHPGEVLYSVFLANRGSPLQGVRLEAGIPAGGGQVEVLATPSRAHKGALEAGRVVWTIDVAPAHKRLGPFGYRVTLEAEPGPVEAGARWSSPSPGSAAAHVVGAEPAQAGVVDLTLNGNATKGLTPLPGTGMSYLLRPGAEPMTLRLSKTRAAPSGDLGLDWVAHIEGAPLGAEGHPTPPIALVLPLDRPLPAFAPLFPYIEQDNAWRAQTSLATVTPDGLHAVVAPDHFSRLAVGVSVPLVHALENPDFQRIAGEITQGEIDLLQQVAVETIAELINEYSDPPVKIDVPRTDSRGECNTECVGDYCLMVCCNESGCQVWSDSEGDEPVCTTFPGKAAFDFGGDVMTYTDVTGETSPVDDLIELPSFFKGAGGDFIGTMVFQASVIPDLGGVGLEFGDGAATTRLLPAVAVADGNQVFRVLGASGAGALGLLRPAEARAYLGIGEIGAQVQVAGLDQGLRTSLRAQLRSGLSALQRGDTPTAATRLEAFVRYVGSRKDLPASLAASLTGQAEGMLELIAAKR